MNVWMGYWIMLSQYYFCDKRMFNLKMISYDEKNFIISCFMRLLFWGSKNHEFYPDCFC